MAVSMKLVILGSWDAVDTLLALEVKRHAA
jgi:hypothetical protein